MFVAPLFDDRKYGGVDQGIHKKYNKHRRRYLNSVYKRSVPLNDKWMDYGLVYEIGDSPVRNHSEHAKNLMELEFKEFMDKLNKEFVKKHYTNVFASENDTSLLRDVDEVLQNVRDYYQNQYDETLMEADDERYNKATVFSDDDETVDTIDPNLYDLSNLPPRSKVRNPIKVIKELSYINPRATARRSIPPVTIPITEEEVSPTAIFE